MFLQNQQPSSPFDCLPTALMSARNGRAMLCGKKSGRGVEILVGQCSWRSRGSYWTYRGWVWSVERCGSSKHWGFEIVADNDDLDRKVESINHCSRYKARSTTSFNAPMSMHNNFGTYAILSLQGSFALTPPALISLRSRNEIIKRSRWSRSIV